MPEPLPSRTDPGPHDAPADGEARKVSGRDERRTLRPRHRLSRGFGAAVLIGLPVTLGLWAAIVWLATRI